MLTGTGLAPPYHFVTVAAATMQALIYMNRHPDRIASFVFCNPFTGADPSRIAQLDERAAHAEREGMRGHPVTLDNRGRPRSATARPMRPIAGAISARSGLFRRHQPGGGALERHAPRQGGAAADHGGCRPLRPGAPARGSEQFAQTIAGARFELIDAVHMMPAQAAGPLLALLQDFLGAQRRVRAAPTPSKDCRHEDQGQRNFVQLSGRRAQGAPWLVFSNSLATNLACGTTRRASSSRSFRVPRYDQRGHGGTEAPAGRYAFDPLLADAVALMDALGDQEGAFRRPVDGRRDRARAGPEHPDRLDRVIVCDSPCQSTPVSAQQWEERIAVAQKDGIEALVEPTVGRWFPPEALEANPPHIDRIRQMIRTTPVNGFIGCAAALADHDYAGGSATVTRPVLFIVGEKDGVTPAAMRKLNEAVKGSRYVELPGAGHISNMDQPQGFTRAIAIS